MKRYRIHTPRITLEVSEEGEFVLYSDIESELETLRASNTIKQANIELLEAENAKLIEGREAMMKQEPVARAFKNSMTGTSSEIYLLREIPEGETNLYANPLPAQQIPEGYALVPIEPTDAMRDAANRIDELASEKEILSSDHFMNIYKAMLSASQPKGDV